MIDENPPTAKENSNKEEKKSAMSENLSTLGIIIAAPLLALFMINFVFQTYEVDGPSMESTLQDNDRLIVWKVPHTVAKITGNDYIPKRYDIIVFNHTGTFGSSSASEKQLIKRVIGIPGDRVVINAGVATVYNAEHPNGYLVDQNGPEAAVIGSTPGNVDQTIKDGEVFVLGDNRENSLDSPELGTIRSDDIVGKLTVRIFPFDKADKF